MVNATDPTLQNAQHPNVVAVHVLGVEHQNVQKSMCDSLAIQPHFKNCYFVDHNGFGQHITHLTDKESHSETHEGHSCHGLGQPGHHHQHALQALLASTWLH